MSKEKCIDILIDNAEISGVNKKSEDITGNDMEKVFDTNVFGVVRVTNAFIPLLRKSDNPVIVNVSSGLGSFETVTDSNTDESNLYAYTLCGESMVRLEGWKRINDILIYKICFVF